MEPIVRTTLRIIECGRGESPRVAAEAAARLGLKRIQGRGHFGPMSGPYIVLVNPDENSGAFGGETVVVETAGWC